MSLYADFQKLNVGGLITLYELDATRLNGEVYRWHGHMGREDWQYIDSNRVITGDIVRSDIIWQGNVFTPLAIKSSGLEMRGDGKASSPVLNIQNNINGVQNALGILCLLYDDFAGAKLTVITTLAKYLDAVNFTDGNPQAANEYRKQVWFVEQKTSENANAITFELSNPVDFEGARIPSREITSFCHWCVHGRYRGDECGYTGLARFTEDGKPTDDPSLDKCGGRLSDCRIRFGDNSPLPFGGFPSSSLINQ